MSSARCPRGIVENASARRFPDDAPLRAPKRTRKGKKANLHNEIVAAVIVRSQINLSVCAFGKGILKREVILARPLQQLHGYISHVTYKQ